MEENKQQAPKKNPLIILIISSISLVIGLGLIWYAYTYGDNFNNNIEVKIVFPGMIITFISLIFLRQSIQALITFKKRKNN